MKHRVTALLIAALGIAAAQAEDLPYLATIGVSLDGETVPSFDGALQLTLHVDRPQQTAERFLGVTGVETLDTDDSTLTVRVEPNARFASSPHAGDVTASFVVDFDETPVVQLSKALAEAEEHLTASELGDAVFSHIANKSYARSFDFASRVAETATGDCTEHAVLLAALARATGLPARVVFGVLLIEAPDQVVAFGHAWTEVFEGNEWQLRDATLPSDSDEAARIRYLPLMLLENEGPGYGFAMGSLLLSMPSKITAVRTDNQSAGE